MPDARAEIQPEGSKEAGLNAPAGAPGHIQEPSEADLAALREAAPPRSATNLERHLDDAST